MNRFVCASLLALCPFFAALPQQDAAPSQQKPATANEIFSGTVSELTPESLTVVRRIPLREGDTRKFALDAQTKVEGRLRLKARVAVRFHADEDGVFRALHIIVR